MTPRPGTWLSFGEAFDLPLAVDLRTAARALGLCSATAYKLIHQGDFPCPVLRLGWQYRIPTTDLLRALGIEERPVYAADLRAGADFAEQRNRAIEFETEDYA
ncbi:Helix-turn-helix domain-containing protein [Streptomyces sp. DvalAA-14]|uniref:helix-turn-helix domain-containing protein n=1 Tax=unclassified Streptomyces TaxID=2593676 RepID=UPI00081BA94C|nr:MULTISPECIES: helix-turn-helix domain-containing protein [unclassified Streptomyces]MYS23602.1 helix-turn-helix domain-containing protein [Streptomyces sp. SID4948]SCE36032.1 Helix-turn-helix domain-containing protein [Streptomyces sp. DvalAA-14]